MRALVTGADGFIGSQLVLSLLEAGYEVRAMVLYQSAGTAGWLDSFPTEIRSQVEIIPGDIRDAGRVSACVAGADVVFHLAALISIPYSYQSPESFVDVNIRGTLQVLEAARQHGTTRVIVVSSSEVYGTAQYVPIDEGHPLQPQSPYSASKIGAESLALSYWHTWQVPVTVVRPFNAYGPRQSVRAFIPAVIVQLLQQGSTIRLGRLDTQRDYTYVTDTAEGLIRLAACEAACGQVVNIATGVSWTMAALAAWLISYLRPDAQIEQDPALIRPHGSEVLHLQGSADRLRALTGWSPAILPPEGLQRTADWYADPAHLAWYAHGGFRY
ncbi:MAG: SDR family NAD(P)-dependent oxidoreductase [Bacteroidia bacterium]|nr:SDR family NAD(P)-dependent oxidoreductase [Bacteroidia bacterium]